MSGYENIKVSSLGGGIPGKVEAGFGNTLVGGEVALKRNRMRARKLPEAIVITNHKQVQKNIGLLQRIFGQSNFVIVDNNKVAEDVNPSVHKAIRRMVNRKPTSYQAVSWIKRELQKRKR